MTARREVERYKRHGWAASFAMECHRVYGASWKDCHLALSFMTGRNSVAWCAVEAARELAESPDLDWLLSNGEVEL